MHITQVTILSESFQIAMFFQLRKQDKSAYYRNLWQPLTKDCYDFFHVYLMGGELCCI